MFTARENQILRRLISLKPGEYLPGSLISSEIGVTTKTIHEDIKKLRSCFLAHGADISAVRSKGYTVLITDSSKYSAYAAEILSSNGEKVVNSDTLLTKMMVSSLLISSHDLSIQYLADQLYTSKTKIYTLIPKARDILRKYNLELSHENGKGYYIEGDEVSVRQMIMLEQLPVYKMEHADKGKNEETETLTAIIVKAFTKARYPISDLSLENFVLYSYIMCNRINSNHSIENNGSLTRFISRHMMNISEEISDGIKKEIGVSMSVSEIEYLSLFLQAERSFDSTQPISSDAEEIVDGMLEFIKEKHGVDLTNDIDLRISLALHFTPMMLRAKNHFEIKNEMLNEVVTSFPLSYDLAVTSSLYLLENYHIKLSKDEISFLAIYFNLSINSQVPCESKKKVLIISTERRGNSLMLRYMILNRFRDRIDKLDFINIAEFDKADLKSYDTVFTTALDYEIVPRGILRINYFLSGQDYSNIEKALTGYKTKRFSEYFQKDLIYRGGALSKEDLIRKLVDLASEKYDDISADQLFKSIMERESVGLTCFGNDIAIPHPNEMVNHSESFVVVAFVKPRIQWNDKDMVSMVFLVCNSKNDVGRVKGFYEGLSQLLADKGLRDGMLQMKSFNSLQNYVSRLDSTGY